MWELKLYLYNLLSHYVTNVFLVFVVFLLKVPLSKEWAHIGVKGYKIEVALTKDELPKYCDVQDENSVYWIANAVKFCGKSLSCPNALCVNRRFDYCNCGTYFFRFN